MALLDFFKTKQNAMTESVVAPENEEVKADNEEKTETSADNKDNIRIIKFVTGRAIDVVYDYINKNNEEMGFNDALVIKDTSYRDQAVAILKNKLNSLIKQVNLRYKDDLRKLDVNISAAREVFAMTTVSNLEAEKAIIEEHQQELADIEKKVEAEDPSVSMMIDSYKRGFMKGVAAAANGILTR